MSDITFIGEPGHEYRISSIGMYSDSTTMVKTEDFDRIVKECGSVLLQPSDMPSLLAGLSVVDGIRAHGGNIHTLLLPYFPGARQDRANPTGDVGFMLQTVARLVNSYEFGAVWVVDPHSAEMLAQVNRLEVFAYDRLYELIPRKPYHAVIAPDKGAESRAKSAAEVFGVPVVTAEKHRDPSTGRLSGFHVDVESGKHYLVVDDICDGGGTFLGLAEQMLKQEATGDLFVAHGIFSKPSNTLQLSNSFDNIYTTNSRDVDCSQVQVLDVLAALKEAAR